MSMLNNDVPTDEEAAFFFKNMVLSPKSRVSRMQVDSKLLAGAGGDDLIGEEIPTVIGFADGVSPEKREALQNCALLSEVWADEQCDRHVEPLKWYRHYESTMKNCGWFSTSFAFNDHQSSQTNVTMDSVVLDIVKLVAGVNTAAVLPLLGRVFDKIKKNTDAITLFDNNSKKGSLASCQIMPCVESAGGTAITVITGIECAFSSNEGGAWFWYWKTSNMKIKRASIVMELNHTIYKRREEMILEKLDKISSSFFDL